MATRNADSVFPDPVGPYAKTVAFCPAAAWATNGATCQNPATTSTNSPSCLEGCENQNSRDGAAHLLVDLLLDCVNAKDLVETEVDELVGMAWVAAAHE